MTRIVTFAFVLAACGTGPKAEPPSTADRCDVARRADAWLAIYGAYLDRLEPVHWTDCERARADLVAAHPAAEKYVTDMRALHAEIDRDPDCKRQFNDATANDARAKAMMARLEKILTTSAESDERCQDARWRVAYDTAIGGLRVL